LSEQILLLTFLKSFIQKYIYFYGSVKDIIKHFPENFLSPEEIKHMKIDVTEIVLRDSEDIAYAKKIQAIKNPRHKIRNLKKVPHLFLIV